MKPVGGERLDLVPLTLPVANGYIERWHRHHAPLVTIKDGLVRTNGGFAWFCLGAVAKLEIVGVAVIGRPTNRNNDDGQTLELLRLAASDVPNVCSFLLGAAARCATAMGAARIITYTLETESGVSLRAAGWNEEGKGIKSCWTKGKGKARFGGSGNTIWREHMEIGKVRWAKPIRDPIDVDVFREGVRHKEAEGVLSLW